MARRIGDVAKAADVGVETVRFYEREGLIDRPRKPERGWRDYGEETVGQLEQVRLAQEFGLTLKDIKGLKVAARAPQAPFCTHVRRTAGARLSALDAKIAALEAKRSALRVWLSLCECREASTACPLYARIQGLAPTEPERRSR